MGDPAGKKRSGLSFRAPFFEHLILGHIQHHVVVNETFLLLKSIQKALLADAVDHTRDPRG